MFRNSESLAQKIVGILLFTAAQGLAAEEPVPQTIKFERQVLEFAPTRPDLTVGICVVHGAYAR